MNKTKMYKLTCVLCICVVLVTARINYTIDERWVCNVKNTCFDCLKLSQCSWCDSANKCFSKSLPAFKDFCQENSTLVHSDFGLSLEENADCSCAGGKMELNCYPPGTGSADEPQCSGRGECVCGHCICDANPDPENPTKTIMGEHCEFDNFSCDGPKCNEGPYSLSQPVVLDDYEKEIYVNNDVPPARR